MRKNVKTIYFSKTIAACDSKLADASKLNDLMNIKGQDHYLTFAKGHFVFKLKSCFSQKLLSYLKPNIM